MASRHRAGDGTTVFFVQCAETQETSGENLRTVLDTFGALTSMADE